MKKSSADSDNQSTPDKTAQKLELLVQTLDKVYPSIPQLMLRSFIQGIFVGLGTTVGVSVILALLTYILAKAQVFPVLNLFLSSVPLSKFLSK